jgi:hypothetical protein
MHSHDVHAGNARDFTYLLNNLAADTDSFFGLGSLWRFGHPIHE